MYWSKILETTSVLHVLFFYIYKKNYSYPNSHFYHANLLILSIYGTSTLNQVYLCVLVRHMLINRKGQYKRRGTSVTSPVFEKQKFQIKRTHSKITQIKQEKTQFYTSLQGASNERRLSA
jgi:hypothetical protein